MNKIEETAKGILNICNNKEFKTFEDAHNEIRIGERLQWLLQDAVNLVRNIETTSASRSDKEQRYIEMGKQFGINVKKITDRL